MKTPIFFKYISALFNIFILSGELDKINKLAYT